MPRVFIPPQMRDLTQGVAEVQLAAETLREVIAQLEQRFPGMDQRLCRDQALNPTLQVSIDQQMMQRSLSAKLGPQSEVHFLPAIGGG